MGLSLATPGSAAEAEVGMCEQPADAYRPSDEQTADPRMVIDADNVELTPEGLSRITGGVTLRQGGREFQADRLDYDSNTGEVVVESQSLFRNPQVIIGSHQARFDLRNESGSFFGTEYTLPTRSARGESKEIRLSADGTAELYSTAYTTCGPSSDAWYIEAKEIRLDHEEGIGTARNAKLRFQGVPILWTPYLQFPIDDRRRTGLLYPSVGQSERTGFDFLWPVYLNLLPNADATLTPRYMSERGLQLGAEGRYLLHKSEGDVAVQYLHDDQRYGDSRLLLQANHRGLLNQRLGVDWTYTEVSDPDYFVDLGGSTDTSTISQLERHARLIYQSPGVYRIQAMVQDYQAIASPETDIEDPYTRLPQVLFDALSTGNWMHTRAGINGEFVNFVRDNSVEGIRTDVRPYLRFERDEIAWYLTSQADLRYTTYKLNETPDGYNDNPDRLLPILSAQGGLRFERLTSSGALQTLEPRGFALFVPYENQDDLPLFDTGEPDFDFTQLFARNRYTGADRVSDARHVAGSLTTRWLDPSTGIERWNASIGQMFRFQAPRVSLPEGPAPPSGATEFIGEVQYRFNPRWTSAVAAQWSPREDQFDRGSVALQYRNPTRGERLDLVYRYRRQSLEQTDVAVSWPVFGNWHVAARSRYSLRESQSLDTLVGLKFETCCWALSTSYRRYILNDIGRYNSGVYLQLELKGLAAIGSGYASMLPGYGNDPGGDERY